jgi:copper homeostasis protein
MHVIVRPRPGDFCYADEEIDIMRRDIERAKSVGVDGVVLGILDPDGDVDVQRTRTLIELARPLSITFHRAFDMSADLLRSLDDVCASGAQRILTSGGEQTCEQGADMIASLVKSAGHCITIMAGGGIRPENAVGLLERTGVREIHVGLSSSAASPMRYRNPRISMGRAAGREYERTQVREEDVRRLRKAVDGL